jgi:hypothetical protein
MSSFRSAQRRLINNLLLIRFEGLDKNPLFLPWKGAVKLKSKVNERFLRIIKFTAQEE